MLNNNLENRGIYGYEKSKMKKMTDTLLDSKAIANGESFEGFQPAKELDEVEETLGRVANYDNMLGNKEERSTHYYNAARESLVPKDTEERRRRNFVLSRNVADDAVNDFYNKSVRPEFEKQRKEAEDAGNEMYKKYISTPGANPYTALGAGREASDPAKVVSSTMERLDNEQLNKLADAYARYGGLDTKSYRDAVLKPSIESRMYNEYIKEGTPGNSIEYIARNAYNNSLTGKLSNIALDAHSHTNTYRTLDNESMQNYGANRAENFAAGVGSLLMDSGIFAGLGSAASKLTGKATSAISNSLTSRVFAKGATRGISQETARRIVDRTFINNIGTRIATSGTAQGLTLGAYDATNSVADDLLYGDSIDGSKAAGSFAKGFGTGMMLGAVGTPLKMKAQGLTGGKKLAASTGILSAESAVFTLGTEVDKLANDIEIEPIDLLSDFGESAATLLTMRMAHWRPKGYREKLGDNGRLKPELTFNPVERQEIRKAGVNPEQFISSIEQELHPRYPSLHGNARRDFIRNYEGLMSADGLSASTRAKLLYIVENKLTSTPPVAVDCDVEISDGTAFVNIKDNAGRNVQRLPFESRAKADAFVESNSGVMRRNRIASIEEMFQRSVDSENFFKQAGEYAKETGVSVEEISTAMYKRAKHQSLSSRETQLIDDIMNRSSYNDIELGNVMHNIRRNIEKRYGLNQGALLSAIDKNRSECTVPENKALSDYESIIRQQAERMRSGVSDEMRSDAQRLIKEQGFGEYDNEHIRSYEQAYNTSVEARPLRGNPNIKEYYKSIYPREYEHALKNGFTYPADGEPPIGIGNHNNPTKGYMYSHDDLARLSVNARDIAKRFNADIELVYDPHQLDSGHSEWGNQTMAKGWYDMKNDKIVINLANNKSAKDLEYTILHEVVGHRGLHRLFGDRYTDFLEEVYNRVPQSVANKLKPKGYETETDKYDKIDEYLADIVEKPNKTANEQGILSRFKDFLGDAMYRMGLPNVRDLSDEKLATIISKHRDAMEKGIPANKRRRKIFGSFNTSHLDNEAYEIKNGSESPQYRYRFIGEKGFENLSDAIKSSPDYKGDPLEGIPYFDLENKMMPRNGEVELNSLKRAKEYEHANKMQQDVPLEGYRHRFIGANGINNLMNSKNSDEYREIIDMAQKMAKYHYSPEYIKRQTGWEIGADGKWRYEIDDSNINLEYYPLMKMRKEYPSLYRVFEATRSGLLNKKEPFVRKSLEDFHVKMNKFLKEKPNLSDVIPDKMFFDAYPEFRDVKVVYKDYLERPCVFNKRKNEFYIEKSMLGKKRLNAYAAAEMQRMIQDYEGFSKGYPMSKLLPDDIYDQAMEPLDKSDMLFIDSDEADRAPVRNFMKRHEYFRKYGQYPQDIPQEQSAREDYMLSSVLDGDAAQSGNVEARNVMKRINFDNETRRTIPAEATEDVSRIYQVSPKSLYDMKKFLKGPIDIIRDKNSKMWNQKYYNPFDYPFFDPTAPLN